MTYHEQRIQELEQELRVARAAATTAEQRLATLADFLPEGVLLYNSEGIISLINEQTCTLLGIEGPASQWLGKTSADMVPTVRALMQDTAAFDAWVEEAWASNCAAISTELQLRDGRTIQVDYISSGSCQAIPNSRLVCFRDVTERKENARQLNEQRDFYETILDLLPGEAAVYGPDHRYRYVNAKSIADPAVRTWIIGKTDAEYVAHRKRNPEIAIRRQQLLNRAVTEGDLEWEESFQLPDGAMRYVLRHLHVIRGEDNQTRMLIGYGTDITQRYKAEEHIRALFAALPDTIVVVDANGLVRDAKLGDTPLLLPEAELIGASLEQLLPHSAGQHLLPCLEQVRQTGQPGACTFELKTQQNKVSFHAARVVALPGAQAVLVILQNVTDQELIRRQLTEQQELIRQVIEVSPTVIYLRDQDGNVVFKNKAYDDLMQRIRHGSVMQGLVEEDKDSSVSQQIKRINDSHNYVLSTRQDFTYATTFTLSDGEERWMQSMKRPFMRSDGSLNVLCVTTDITDIKLARQQLENSEKKYRDLVYYSQALICTHDLEGNMLSVNPAIERLMGLPAHKLVGRNLREVVPAEYQGQLQEYLAGFAQQPGQRSIMALLTRPGDKRYLQYNNYQVKEAGRPTYIVASAYDITESVLTERALRQAKLEVEESARAKDNFLASMSHEIRTPLNGVLGMAALLTKTELNKPQRELLDTINHSGQHLLAVVNDVLDMAKITAGQLELEHAAFDLWASVQGAVQTMTYLAEEKGLYLSVVPLTIQPPYVLGDSHRLNQVLLNLLSNAIKFTEYGSVTLGGEVLCDTPVAITIRFWVRDTGIGIPEDKQEQIFEIFTQASTDTTRRFGGSGLGLSISQHLVQLMGGELLVDSVPGQGSTFSFTITLARTPAAPVRALKAAEQPALAKLRVLLAEDNRINQRISTLMLQPWGVEVDCASNGPEALDLFDVHLYDVVLMDIQMPGMSGVEVTDVIRRHPDPRRANVPIIALTANALRRDQERYLAAGMNACLIKPFEEQHLHQTIVSVLNGMRLPVVTRAATQPTEATSGDLYDLSFLKQTSNGNEQFVERMLEVFLRETPATLVALQQACTANDWPTVGQLAHGVKPIVLLLRIAGGASAIQTLEASTTKPEEARKAALFLCQQLELTCQAIKLELHPK
ncbi:PAS domain-containing protein [Hymenobacter sp. YC55]|uniref:PAS domain-containing protein n=1 Tax=Hymenobacter sp. YC55 TaxID=3034019 RepID=UPI0023F8C307|nr:PAS domain-containing protein [Hymenobacter sp. YC55]MDF7809991.1 PAS domain-containing protein [Hymenobacter sp. YC55]